MEANVMRADNILDYKLGQVDVVVLGSEGESGVDDQSLGSSDAEVGMEEKNFDHFRHKLDSGNNYFSILHHFFA